MISIGWDHVRGRLFYVSSVRFHGGFVAVGVGRLGCRRVALVVGGRAVVGFTLVLDVGDVALVVVGRVADFLPDSVGQLNVVAAGHVTVIIRRLLATLAVVRIRFVDLVSKVVGTRFLCVDRVSSTVGPDRRRAAVLGAVAVGIVGVVWLRNVGRRTRLVGLHFCAGITAGRGVDLVAVGRAARRSSLDRFLVRSAAEAASSDRGHQCGEDDQFDHGDGLGRTLDQLDATTSGRNVLFSFARRPFYTNSIEIKSGGFLGMTINKWVESALFHVYRIFI